MTTRWRTRHRGDHADRGAAAVEFAIVFVLLIFIIMSLIDFGRLFFVYQGVKSASREGARTMVVSNRVTAQAAAEAAAESAAALAGGGDADVTFDPDIANPCPPNVGAPVTVGVSVPFSWFTPALPLLGIVIGPLNIPSVESSTTMRCEQ